MKKNYHLIFFALLMLISLSGCVSLIQEMVIHEDGSGTFSLALGVETIVYPQFQEAIPEAYEMENLLRNLLVNENTTNYRLDYYEANGYTWESILVEVGDYYRLFEDPQEIGLAKIDFNRDENGYSFQQTLDLEGSNMRIPGVNLIDLAGAGYTIRLVTPQITATNGLQEAAGVSVWQISLSDLLQEGTTTFMRADYVLEPFEGVFIPWESLLPYLVTGVLALGGLSILVIIIVKTTGKEKKQKLRF